MKIVERVARALCLEDGQTWDELDEIGLLRFYSMAVDAIRSMQEPSDEMVEAMENCGALDWSLEPGEGLDGISWGKAFKAAISAALNEK